MKNYELGVQYTHGGEHALLRWNHHYERHHLLLERSAERLDDLACRTLEKKGCWYDYEPALLVEIVAPSVSLAARYQQEKREDAIRSLRDNLVRLASSIYDKTRVLPDGFRFCPRYDRDSLECWGDECNHGYTGILPPDISMEALRERKEAALDAMRAEDGDPGPGKVRLSQARVAGEDETLYGAHPMDGVSLVELTESERGAVTLRQWMFFYVNPRVIPTPKLDALRDAYREAEAREKAEAEQRRAARKDEASEYERADLERAQRRLAILLEGEL